MAYGNKISYDCPIIYTDWVAIKDMEITSTFDSLPSNWNTQLQPMYLLNELFWIALPMANVHISIYRFYSIVKTLVLFTLSYGQAEFKIMHIW